MTNSYLSRVKKDVSQCMEEMGCQPILFVGTGMSRRYFGAPSWETLLQQLSGECGQITQPYAYYKQTFGSAIDIGQEFAKLYQQWAWSAGKDQFPEELFTESCNADTYIKHHAAQILEKLTPPDTTSITDPTLQAELEAIKRIQPHALITTNYDQFLERVFPEFTAVIGQSVLHNSYTSVGEIFKIHGCSSLPSSMVLTRRDYDEFSRKKKYISAKLLTYFIEHPVLFIGYSVSDPNVQAILSDIDEALSPDNSLIANIYFLEWARNFDPEGSYPAERLIQVGEHRSIRVKSITASSFDWVFDAFGTPGALDRIHPRILRALMARTYDLVRRDIPRQTIEVDYKIIEQAVASAKGLPTLLGISTLDNPGAMNANFPYTLTELAQKLGFRTWHGANDLLDRIKRDKGINLKSSDNMYQITNKQGKISFHKYSDRALSLLTLVRDGKSYVLEGKF